MKFNIEKDSVLGNVYSNGIIRIHRARKGSGFVGYIIPAGSKVADKERHFPTLKAAKEYYSN